MRILGLFIVILCLFSACAVGPDYKRPAVPVPATFTEASIQWKTAQPQDTADRGQWWEIFNEPKLNELETELNKSNQNIAVAAANYRQAQELVNEARAAFFPTLTGVGSVLRQKAGTSGSSGFISTSTDTPDISSSRGVNATFTSYSMLLNATWTPDIWGQVRRTVEGAKAGAEASGALWAGTRLAQQTALAQYYFELRAVDTDQQLLQATMLNYKETLKLTKFQYASGVASRADVVQAQTQLQTAQAQAIQNGIARAQYQHAIAVLIGKLPEDFSFAAMPLTGKPPQIPLIVPSTLLERRPDIAQAERLMAQANAQIGVATAAFFPTIPITASAGVQNTLLSQLFTYPATSWAVGPQLAETLFEGGARWAAVKAARAGYDASVANYKQTVLAAFQNVEDNLSSLRILEQEGVALNKAAASARLAEKLVVNQYKAGTVPYSSVITAQTNAYTAEKSAADVVGLQMTTAAGLVAALGGGWNASEVIPPATPPLFSKKKT